MTLQFPMKRGDTAPSLRATLRNPDGSAPDLTGATVKFLMRDRTSGAVRVNGSAAIVTAASGIVQYDWQVSDTSTAGTCDAEFEVTFASGKIETFPNSGFFQVVISGDIA